MNENSSQDIANPSAAEPTAIPGAADDSGGHPAASAERDAARARVEAQTRLPPGLRKRLAAAVAAAESPRLLPLETVLAALDAALPDFLLEGAAAPVPAAHPGGEAFFSGDPRALSAAQADLLARQQLAACGFAPRAGRAAS